MQDDRNLEMLHVTGLVKRFGSRTILHGIDLSVHPKEAVALVGKNGAGKSTTLRCIVSEVGKNQGTILISGKDLDLEPLHAKARLGYVADDPFLYPYLTGREHLLMWQTFRRMPPGDMTIASALAEKLALDTALDTQVRTYSRGMRQKLAFIGGLFHRPHLIVMDEPFTAMDQSSTQTACEILQEALLQGTGLIFTTHQSHLIEIFQATVVTLVNGEISNETL